MVNLQPADEPRPLKCRIDYDPDSRLWVFYSPYGLRATRRTFEAAVSTMDTHIQVLKRYGLVAGPSTEART